METQVMVTRIVNAIALVAAMVGIVGLAQSTAGAIPPNINVNKVTICHRTASYTNPYVQITVDQDSVDGNLANDKGQGDHYLEHRGPVFYPSIPKHTEWGDIIPPV